MCHTLLPTLSKFERVSNSVTQGKELKSNPDLLDLLRDKVTDNRLVPISLKEASALERSMRSMMETYSSLTWAVIALFRSLHDEVPPEKEIPFLPQLQRFFSKSCDNLAAGLTAHTAFLTLKRRQLLLSHAVPSVSDAQKRNLMSDPFFGTGSLFASTSVEAARSAARDTSLFKPHIKSSSSTQQSRRGGFSSASSSRPRPGPGPSRQTSQRRPSPPRHQPYKKGEPRFHKKSSDASHKRGGFRR